VISPSPHANYIQWIATMLRLAFALCCFTALLAIWAGPLAWHCAANDEPVATSGEDDVDEDEDDGGDPLNLASKTGGGTQLWTDHWYRDGYRIQQNVWTGHWRLLDANNVRCGWGSEKHCEKLLDQVCPLPASQPAKHDIILLHGLMRTRGSMMPLEKKLVEASFDEVIRFSYASTRGSIADHAKALRDVLEHLPKDTEFSFVGHSMGNIVVRRMLGDLEKDDPAGILDRCRSMVMLGPPNQGADIARNLARTGLFGLVTGKGGMELGPHWEELEKGLATPSFPFAIIAGDLSHNPIQNPLVEGSSDLVVSVEEAKLEGAEYLKTVPVLHSVLMNDETVQTETLDFIKTH
jgi:pimeloyl-ACP methyl ester carboxylesterase